MFVQDAWPFNLAIFIYGDLWSRTLSGLEKFKPAKREAIASLVTHEVAALILSLGYC